MNATILCQQQSLFNFVVIVAAPFFCPFPPPPPSIVVFAPPSSTVPPPSGDTGERAWEGAFAASLSATP